MNDFTVTTRGSADTQWPYFAGEGAEAQRGPLSVTELSKVEPGLRATLIPRTRAVVPSPRQLLWAAAERRAIQEIPAQRPTRPSLGHSVLVLASSSETSLPEDQNHSGNFSFSLEMTQEGSDSAPALSPVEFLRGERPQFHPRKNRPEGTAPMRLCRGAHRGAGMPLSWEKVPAKGLG